MLEVQYRFKKAYNEELDFDAIPDNYISNDKMSVIFLRLTDDVYRRIIEEPSLLKDKNIISYCLKERGDNIHLIKAFGEGYSGFKKIINELKNKYSPKTLTWFKDDFYKLHNINIRRT